MARCPAGPLPGLDIHLDGTIADTEEVHRRAFNQAFAGHGLPWAWSPAEYAGLLWISGGREEGSCSMRGNGYRRPYHGAQLIELARRLHSAKSALYARMLTERGVRFGPVCYVC